MSEDNNSKIAKRDDGNPLMELVVGIALLAAGLFMLSKRVIVHTGWYTWRIGSFYLSSGTVVIPLIIGIIWYFYNPKSLISKIIMGLGALFIVLSVIMSVSINFVATSMFDYILILGMVAAGLGLLLKNYTREKKKKDE